MEKKIKNLWIVWIAIGVILLICGIGFFFIYYIFTGPKRELEETKKYIPEILEDFGNVTLIGDLEDNEYNIYYIKEVPSNGLLTLNYIRNESDIYPILEDSNSLSEVHSSLYMVNDWSNVSSYQIIDAATYDMGGFAQVGDYLVHVNYDNGISLIFDIRIDGSFSGPYAHLRDYDINIYVPE